MADEMGVKFASGGTSSKQPRLELIPYLALLRMAARFELGDAKRPDGSAWNALSAQYRQCLTDKEFILARAAHTAQHAMKLKAILAGEIPDDGDDHAGAVLWGGAFLACATDPEFLKRTEKEPLNCSACGGTGTKGEWVGAPPAEWIHTGEPCPACKGTGKQGKR